VTALDRVYSRRVAGISGLSSMPTKCSSASFVGVVVELRKSRRYRLLAPTSFSWERPDGLLQEGRGTIRDISDRGVFVTGYVVPPVGARLDVDVYLSSLEEGGANVHLHGEGTVVRVDQESESTKGFAATVAFQTEPGSTPIVIIPKRLH
jgi:hypothetical protein